MPCKLFEGIYCGKRDNLFDIDGQFLWRQGQFFWQSTPLTIQAYLWYARYTTKSHYM